MGFGMETRSNYFNSQSLVALLVIAIGFLLRCYAISAGSFEGDEGYSILVSQNSFSRIWELAANDSNPPLGNSVFVLWRLLSNGSFLGYESLSLLFGTLTLFATFHFLNERFTFETAFFGLLLLSISTCHLFFSQYIRIYSLTILITVLLAELFLRFIEHRGRWTSIFLILGSWLTVNLHYIGLLVVGAFFIGALILLIMRRESVLGLLQLALVLIIALIPNGIILYRQYALFYSFDWIEKPSTLTLYHSAFHLSSSSGTLCVIFGSLIIVAILDLMRSKQHKSETITTQEGIIFLICWLFVPIALGFLASILGRPFFNARYSVFCLIPFLSVSAFGLTKLNSNRLKVVVLAVIAISSTYSILEYYDYRKQSAWERELAEFINHQYRPGDVIYHATKRSFVSGLVYHHRELNELFSSESRSSSNIIRYYLDRDRTVAPEDLSSYERVIVVNTRSLRKVEEWPLKELISRLKFLGNPEIVRGDKWEVLIFEKQRAKV